MVFIGKIKALNSFLSKPLFLTLFIIIFLFISYFSISVEWLYPVEKIAFTLFTLFYILFLIRKCSGIKKVYSILLSTFLLIQLMFWLFILTVSIGWFGGVRCVEREIVDWKLYYIIEYNGYKHSIYILKKFTINGGVEIHSSREPFDEINSAMFKEIIER